MKNNKFTLVNINKLEAHDLEQIQPHDVDAVREIILSAENNAATYNMLKRFKTNTIDNKIKNDTFIYGAALKGIRNIIDMYIKEYINLFCRRDTRINQLLSTNDRIYIYNYFLDKWLSKEFN